MRRIDPGCPALRIWLNCMVLCGLLAAAACRPAAPDFQPPESGLPQGPLPPPGSPQIYYVRPDGGDLDQCTGRVDAPYPGEGAGRPCAWDHPFRALPPSGPARLQGGDTLIIGPGSYPLGLAAPGAESCSPEYPWDCHLPPLPSGPDAEHPTRLLGAGWDAGCPAPPELWGRERAEMLLNLAGSSHIELACLELTDHSGCVEGHTGSLACPDGGYPYGDWAVSGLYAADSEDVYLHDLDIHGLAVSGIQAGRLRDWRLENVRLAANGWVGWEGDLGEDSANRGTLEFSRWLVEWNGCAEDYPGEVPGGCWSQTAGGYGDGVGTAATGGDWLIRDSAFLHNTSDGLDLLYHELGGSIRLERVRAEGNAGNPVKLTGAAQVISSALIANCAFFEDQPFTYQVDSCRALGNALELAFTAGEQAVLSNNTFYGQGDGLLYAGPRAGYTCRAPRIQARNNIFLGGGDYYDPSDRVFLFFTEDCSGLELAADYNLYHQVKLSAYQPGPNDLQADPLLTGPFTGLQIGIAPQPGSPAATAGDPGTCPEGDLEGRPILAGVGQDPPGYCHTGALAP